eukprot:TRINITY_DN1176_c0_g2_i2.p1 TRINITY_DN1176_c0_g2~~TRINITY_DN1176_c0_g2_i2.p1  ORF type:complete len:215 (-),score=29.63 TRINITY_DN1176_c0_g2_i2:56-700(-)
MRWSTGQFVMDSVFQDARTNELSALKLNPEPAYERAERGDWTAVEELCQKNVPRDPAVRHHSDSSRKDEIRLKEEPAAARDLRGPMDAQREGRRPLNDNIPDQDGLLSDGNGEEVARRRRVRHSTVDAPEHAPPESVRPKAEQQQDIPQGHPAQPPVPVDASPVLHAAAIDYKAAETWKGILHQLPEARRTKLKALCCQLKKMLASRGMLVPHT